MITLQSTQSYSSGEPPPAPVEKVLFRHPSFQITRSNSPSGGLVANTSVEYQHDVWLELASKKYRVEILTGSIYGWQNYGSDLRSYVAWLMERDGTHLRLADFTLPVKVNYPKAKEEATVELEILWFNTEFTDLATVIDRPKDRLTPSENSSNTGQTSLAATSGDPNADFDQGLYAINKAVYREFFATLFPTADPGKEYILLYVINNMVQLGGITPVLATGKESEQRATILDLLQRHGLPPTEDVYNYFHNNGNFSKLFDFPLHLPKVEVLSVAGNIHIAPGTTNTSVNWDLYHLSAEFSTHGDGEGSQTESHNSQYLWNSTSVRTNNKIVFQFAEPHLLRHTRNPVTVRVKAFHGSEIWSKSFDSADPKLRNLDIEVPFILPAMIDDGSSGDPMKGGKSLRGKIVSLSKACTLKGTIIIEARATDGAPWVPVSAGASDKDGNFTLPYPYGTFAAARALVSLDKTHSTPLQMTSGIPNETISSDFLYILIQLENDGGEKSEDCNCNPSTVAGRLPSQDDLLQSNQFTQDLGGGCMNLSVPNRTLREFNYHAIVRHTDPDVAYYTLRAETFPRAEEEPFPKTYYYLDRGGKVKRGLIDLDNPVQWQDISEECADTQIYQAVTLATGHILHYKSEFKADGYSLGDLIYSLPLAPGQKKQIITFDSSHTFLGSESQELSQTEDLAADLVNERDIVDQIAGNVSEQLSGSSSATTSGVSAGLGAAGSTGMFGASLGVAGGYSNANSKASQHGSRGVSQFFSEKLRNGINQNASSYRRLNATAITTVQENQKYSAMTEVVANHNHCHSITMMYFQVLRHFAVFQELVNVEECVFVPFLMTRFTIENIGKWADALAPRLLSLNSNSYMKPMTFSLMRTQKKHPLTPAFDAVERIKTDWKMVDYPTGRYCDEVIEWIEGRMEIVARIPRPSTKYDNIVSLPVTTKEVLSRVPDARQAAKDIVTSIFSGGLFGGDGKVDHVEVVETRARIFDKFMRLDENFASVPPSRCVRIISFEPLEPLEIFGISLAINPLSFFENEADSLPRWLAYAELLGYPKTADGLKQMLNKYFKGQLIGDWDAIWYKEIAPQVFTALLNSIHCDLSGKFDTSQLAQLRSAGEQVVPVSFANLISKVRSNVHTIKLWTTSAAGKTLSTSQLVFRLKSLRVNYSTAHYNGLLFNGPLTGDLLDEDGASAYTPLTAAEKKNTRLDDKFLAQKLVTHLNQNLEYYNKVLWHNLDADRRYLLLDGFNIETFNKYGEHEGYRSLASVLKNELVVVVGNSLVFPVASGYHVDQSLVVARDSEGQAHSEDLLNYYHPGEPTAPYRLSVPTRGLFSEAHLGACDSCERIKPNSSQDWTKFTTDEPTAINALTPPVPTVTDYKPTFKDFAPPIISIQNAPAAPDPSTGLKAVTELMGKSDLFKDVTGLDQNRKNTLQTYMSNNENVRALAQMATGMTMQAHNTAQSEQILESMKQTNKDKLLSDEDMKELVKDHFKQRIKGNSDEKTEGDKNAVPDSLVKAVDRGDSQVSATFVDKEGSVQSLNVAPSMAPSVKPTPLLPKFVDFEIVYPDFKHYTKEQAKQLVGGDIDKDWISDTCTVRISRAIQYAQGGFSIPYKGETGPPGSEPRLTVKGADGKNYIIRTQGMHMLLTAYWGPPLKWKVKKGENLLDTLVNMRGVIAFGDRHYDLFDGNGITSRGGNPSVKTGLEYYGEEGVTIRFWSLP